MAILCNIQDAVVNYTVTVYGSLTTTGIPIKFQYSTDGGSSWTDIDGDGYFDSTSCLSRGSVTVASGTTISLQATDGASVYFHARTLNSTSCPGSPYTACSSLVSNITSNRNVAITVDTSGSPC